MESIEKDELFEEAARIVVREQNASTSLLQRKLKLGYNRAGRIMDSLVDANIVSGGIGAKREGGEREVLFKTELSLCCFLGIEYVAYLDSGIKGSVVMQNTIPESGKNEAETKIGKFILVRVPTESEGYFINNIGCLRYSYNEGRQSTAVEPMEIGVYLEKGKHKIVGDSTLSGEKIIVIEVGVWQN